MFQSSMNALQALIVSVSLTLMGVSSFYTKFKISPLCVTFAGLMPFIHKDALSDIHCGAICAKHSGCLSFTYVAANSTCTLNNGTLADEHMCDSNIEYGVKLLRPICTEPVGNLRLCNGSLTGEAASGKGRVEVLFGDQWGSVCDDGWEAYSSGSDNAKVVCGMFGYTNGGANLSATFGVSKGPIFLDSVTCSGTEPSLLNCSHAAVGLHDCSHSEDVGVVCY